MEAKTVHTAKRAYKPRRPTPPQELLMRFNQIGEEPTLERLIEDARYMADMIADGGSVYNDDPDEGEKIYAECRIYLKKAIRYRARLAVAETA